MKKLPLLLSAALLLSSVPFTAFAQEADQYADRMKDVVITEAEGNQAELGTTVKNIIEVDGLKFKDLNSNGNLDVYEDWRADIEDRLTDLISQMTLEEKCTMFFHICTCGNPSGVDFSDPMNLWAEEIFAEAVQGGTTGKSMWYYIDQLGITHFLDNSNGTPQQQIVYHNAIQQMGEDTRLGIPITLSSDRQYNAWGGMIDTPHDALATCDDTELASVLWEKYSKETRAVGYHVLLHPYGMELGSWNGEDPERAGEASKVEIEAIQAEGGAYACAKHFIARGGDASFSTATENSETMTVDNWMTAWAKALEGNPKWIMTNGYSTGLWGQSHVDFDAITMSYLRDTLGFEGVVLSDWGAQGSDNAGGIGVDGTNLDELTIPERYAYTINLGLDQIGSPDTGYNVENPGYTSDIGAVIEAVNQGLITEERVNETCRRVLRTKFELGLFENPYSDAEYALSLSASDEYIAQQWDIVDLDTLQAARNPETVETERQVEAKSAILIKNDNNILPLSADLKVYFDSTAAADTKSAIISALSGYAQVTETMEEADVVIADCTSYNDAAEMMVEDAKDLGKKVIIVSNCVDPTLWAVENGDAVLFMTFSRTADHGTGAGGFITTTEPCVYAELLYGVRVPEGLVVKEIARNSEDQGTEWQNLAGDIGADSYVRMLLLAIMKTSENNTTPNNYGDPLICYEYGMRYGEQGDFVYDTLVLPRASEEVTTESDGSTSTSVQTVVKAQAGVPFDIYVLLWNNGSSDITTVQVMDGENVIAEKVMAVNGGSWRVVRMSVTIDTPGEHTISVGDQVKTITIAE
ncbi:MAG: glycoside hydrolase family 3 protein [Parasporobacterium sp.]|nr:glycoside hydrolase family 3 protein [Parasporobacterium sp.]